MLRAHFLNQGRVDSILLECDGEYAFIDGGYRRNGLNAVKYMRSLGVTRLKYYIASHGHKNHIGAAAAIIGSIKVDTIIVGRMAVFEAILKYADSLEEAEAIDGCDVRVMQACDTIMLGGAMLICLGPERQKSCSCGAYAENYNSLILRVDYGGAAKLLLTGDSTAAIIAKCGVYAIGKVLKSPHHAGSQPMSLLKQVKPKQIVICSNVKAGRAYRKRIEAAGARLYNVCEGRVIAEL